MRITTRAATALATGALLATNLAGCGDDESGAADDPTVPVTSSDATPPTGSTPPTASSTSSTSPTAPGESATTSTTEKPGTVAVPVYFVGDTPQGPRLYREFQRVPAVGKLLSALRIATSGTALDPDYRTLFPPGGGFDAADAVQRTTRLDLSDPSWISRGSLTRAEARLAVQALVYTVQGVSQNRFPVTVRAPGDGARAATLLGVPIRAGIRAAEPLTVLAFVNVTTPEQGATVSGTLKASGVASSFEGTVPWEVRRGGADGPVVKRGFAQAAGYVDKLYPWSTAIDVEKLTPGAYTFVARTDDPSGGEGPGPTVDTRDFVVR